MRKVTTLLLSILAVSLFGSIGMITPASATEPRYFAFAPVFYPGSMTDGFIIALKLPPEVPVLTPFIPLMNASFHAYVYFDTVQEEEPQRVCHYKALITCLDEVGSTLVCSWNTVWDLDPQIHPEAIGVVEGGFIHGTGALDGFHGRAYTVLEPPGVPIDPNDPELCWATYHFDP